MIEQLLHIAFPTMIVQTQNFTISNTIEPSLEKLNIDLCKPEKKLVILSQNRKKCCGSWKFIPDPGSNNRNKRGGKNIFVVLPLFLDTNIIKIAKNFIFEQIKMFFS